MGNIEVYEYFGRAVYINSRFSVFCKRNVKTIADFTVSSLQDVLTMQISQSFL